MTTTEHGAPALPRNAASADGIGIGIAGVAIDRERARPSQFVHNVVSFARALRRAGLAVGPDRALAALAAIELVGVDRRADVHAALSAVMLDHHDQQPLFDAAFAAFWRDPLWLQKLMHQRLPAVSGRAPPPPPRARRLDEALAATTPPRSGAAPAATQAHEDEIRFDITFSHSERERLQRADFATMTSAEYAQARELAERLPPPVSPVQRRRWQAAARGRIDLRATLRRQARQPDLLTPARAQPRREWPSLVVLLDISGSMDRYARLFLHYVHGLTRRHLRVHSFTFGTRLTPITRSLRQRDPDLALAQAEAQVPDWRGGTRIADCLDAFNRRWARRVLAGNAAVLLVTDGLDRGDAGALDAAAAQLHRLAHEVVWLNPLLRFDGFEPRAAGVRALLAHVDRHLPVHNLASLADLGRALREGPRRPARAPSRDEESRWN